MNLRNFTIRRLLLMIPVLFGLLIITFTLTRLTGDPVNAYIEDPVKQDNPAFRQKIIEEHHLDEPPYIQFFYYLQDLIRGEWGFSDTSNMGVLDTILKKFPATFELTLFAVSISILAAIPIGITSALHKDEIRDQASRLFALTGVSMPIFWLALLLQYFFFFMLKVQGLPSFPAHGRVNTTQADNHPIPNYTGLVIIDSIIAMISSILHPFIDPLGIVIDPIFSILGGIVAAIIFFVRDDILAIVGLDGIIDFFLPLINFLIPDAVYVGGWENTIGYFDRIGDALVHLALPAFALSYAGLAIQTRMIRSSMLEVLKQDYITQARAKGLSERVVIYKHALKNAILPAVTVAGLTFGSLLSGAVLTETIFAWPGMGRWSVQSISQNDHGSIMGFTLLIGLIFIFVNLIVDLLYAFIDPRIRYE